MPCSKMKELEVTFSKYTERRRNTAKPSVERRKLAPGWLRVGQARAAYIIQWHRRSCMICRGVTC